MIARFRRWWRDRKYHPYQMGEWEMLLLVGGMNHREQEAKRFDQRRMHNLVYRNW